MFYGAALPAHWSSTNGVMRRRIDCFSSMRRSPFAARPATPWAWPGHGYMRACRRLWLSEGTGQQLIRARAPIYDSFVLWGASPSSCVWSPQLQPPTRHRRCDRSLPPQVRRFPEIKVVITHQTAPDRGTVCGQSAATAKRDKVLIGCELLG